MYKPKHTPTFLWFPKPPPILVMDAKIISPLKDMQWRGDDEHGSAEEVGCACVCPCM